MAKNNGSCDFTSDPRTPCKYGSLCYQKNPNHHEKYKHPSKVLKDETPERPTKKQKPNSAESKNDRPNETEKPKPSVSPKRSPEKPVAASPKAQEVEKQKPSHVLLKDKVRNPDSKKLKLEEDPRDIIKQLFLVSMPEDFYSFWEMCKMLNNNNPLNALKDVKLKLVGPFDVLAGKVTDVYEEDLPDLLRHSRYYYDPPELQTVLACDDARCYHLGYYRDDPGEPPVFVASNALNSKNPEKNGELVVTAPNLFAAVNVYLEALKTDPFSRMKVPKFQKTLADWAKEKGFSLEKRSKEMDSRSRKIVAKTFHGAGIVVPVDKKNDVGYRELAATNAMIKKILKGLVESRNEEDRLRHWEQLNPVITFANIANDECDFGTSLELGLDLFTYGSPLLHRSARQMLTTAYNLLGRSPFVQIIEAHLDDRREGRNLSVL